MMAERKPRQPQEFTPSQVAAIQPYLPALLKRYREVAETGETERPDPICNKVKPGRCFECPVFGEEARGPGRWTKPKRGASEYIPGDWYHCEDVGFWPEKPQGLTDGTGGVQCGTDPDKPRKTKGGLPAATQRERAQSWGAEMVARLEGLRSKAPAQE